MSTAQHSIIPLSTLAHAAMEATDYTPDGRTVIVRADSDGIADVSVHPLDRIDPSAVDAAEPGTAIALMFPEGDEDVTAAAHMIDRLGENLRHGSGAWDTVIARGGVRFRIYSQHGWLDEPETDPMPNDQLDALISAFAGAAGRFAGHFDPALADEASGEWLEALNARLYGAPAPFRPTALSLQAGSVRDAVIVWAIGEEGRDRLAPGERFVPPKTAPAPARINAAYDVLADRVGEPDTVHALACASYLSWWAGYPRLATHLYYRARSTRQRSRLSALVWTALLRGIVPHWMR
ncbi:hypothetical protein [Flaviflexus huanghaiensis]|uniref:hypothetical protein n=1 Tax=Flaviflexus huanghaiensis TaxID=1111473 RepID=UPI0015FE7CE9|nr:hypothetical protein [Flaviflexus huanghaiensis]